MSKIHGHAPCNGTHGDHGLPCGRARTMVLATSRDAPNCFQGAGLVTCR